MGETERADWSKAAHEHKVENFYGWGAEHYGDFHDGYLNFGLWEDGIDDFVAAAENMVNRMGLMLGLDEDSHLLDVACGMGTQDVFLIKNFSPRRIDALDVTWKHIEHGRRRARAAGLEDRLEFHHGTATQLPFTENHFTHVLSIEGTVHFDTREKFLQEALRVLRPGGVIAICDYSLKRLPRGAFERGIIKLVTRLWKVPAANVYTSGVYGEKMRAMGYQKVDVREVGELTIPGYYREQRKPETIAELAKIRGFVAGRLGTIIDIVLYKAYRMGLLEYLMIRAEKA